jgi:hypothetical protein
VQPDAKAKMLADLEARAQLADANGLLRAAQCWRNKVREVAARVGDELIYVDDKMRGTEGDR